MAATDAVVAIYWDFENVHACLIDDHAGEQTYRKMPRNKQQEVVVDVARVVRYAVGFGHLAVHRAYANWQPFGKYAGLLRAHAIDLVQLFPLNGAKNGADIRLAIDVIEDLRLHPEITHVVVVGSDCDYAPVAQRCRARGIHFVGVGTARTAPAYPDACDEFVRYHALPPTPGFAPALLPVSAPVTEVSLSGAGDLVERAIRAVATEHGTAPWAIKAAIQPMIKRLDPGFDESAFGFDAFTDLVRALEARIVERKGTFDHELAVRADVLGRADLGADDPSAPVALIEGLLKRKKQRLPADRQLLWTATGLIPEIFAAAPDGVVSSFDQLGRELETAAAAHGIALPDPEFRKVKALLWRAHAFEPLGYAFGLRLRETDPAALRLRTVIPLLRLLPSPAETDLSVLAEAIFGPAATDEQRDLVSAALQHLAAHPQAAADADDADADDADDEDDPEDADEADADAPGGASERHGWESAA